MKSLYQGRTKDGVRCKECGKGSERATSFTDLQIPVRRFGAPPFKSLEDGPSIQNKTKPFLCSTQGERGLCHRRGKERVRAAL